MSHHHHPLQPPPFVLSGEQEHIVDKFKQGCHIVSAAVAGAGKTSTLLQCGKSKPEATCLLLTYNKRLQLEVAERARGSCPKMTVSTYHAAAGKAYKTIIKNDRLFAEAVLAPPPCPQEFDVLMLDEAQDMVVEYFTFVCHLLVKNPQAQLVVVGDERQAISEYRGARFEFLTRAPELFADHATKERLWVRCELRESYRLSPQTAAFVNDQLYKQPGVIVGKNLSQGQGFKPLYFAVKANKMTQVLGGVVREAVRQHGAENVFVLAPSVRDICKKLSPLALLVKYHLRGILTYVTDNDSSDLDPRASDGKLVIMSFNASKGCERECVVLVGFDESYFQYYNRSWLSRSSLPNVLTVAATRAKTQLIIVASADKTLRTISTSNLCTSAHVVADRSDTLCAPQHQSAPPPPIASQKGMLVSVKALLRHLATSTVQRALQLIQTLPCPDDLRLRLEALGGQATVMLRNLPSTQFGASVGVGGGVGGYFENLSFVYGNLAPVLAQVALTNKTDFAKGLDNPEVCAPSQANPFAATITQADFDHYPACFWLQLRDALNAAVHQRTEKQWVVLAVASHAFFEGRHHIARQVLNYDWVNSELLAASCQTAVSALDPVEVGAQFEVNLGPVGVGAREIYGRADFIDDQGCVWEFKLSDLGDMDVLQLACYIALRGGGEGKLLSLLKRSVVCIKVDAGDAMRLLEVLAQNVKSEQGCILKDVKKFQNKVAFDGSRRIDAFFSRVPPLPH